MSHYNHLTLVDRERILYFLALGSSQAEIASKVGCSKSTVSREIRRNSVKGEYLPVKAQKMYEHRRLRCRPARRLSDPELFELVYDRFVLHQWSPEQIAGRLKLEGSRFQISFITIYRAIYARMLDEPNISSHNRGAVRKLRHRGKSRHTRNYKENRGKIPISNDISQRPAEANDRSRIGDWEADTVVGKRDKTCLLSLVDRKSRFLLGKKCAGKRSEEVKDAMIEKLQDQPCHSITPDRGKEFAKHALVTEKLNLVQFYFPLPHHPWQRGTNENTNGLLREYFPKETDVTDIPEEYIQEKIDELNKRPRKCLGYRTPYEVYYSAELHLV